MSGFTIAEMVGLLVCLAIALVFGLVLVLAVGIVIFRLFSKKEKTQDNSSNQ